MGEYSLNLFVPGLNESSIEADMKTTYCYMALRFNPDKNIDVDTSKMMGMINEAKEGLKNTLRNNDAIREEERVCAAQGRLNFLLMTILIQKQAIHHMNQQHHLIKHPHLQLNTLLIMNKTLEKFL